MKILKTYLIAFLFSFGTAYALDAQISIANQKYLEKDWAEAYRIYTGFLFSRGNGCNTVDYYVALSGRAACMKHLSSHEMMLMELSLFGNLLDTELHPDECALLRQVLDKSVYMDCIRETQK